MIKAFNVEEKSIKEIQNALQQDEITSKELVLIYLERIAKFDQSGPRINSIIEINPDAVHIAESLDYERKVKGVRGSLHGIPVLIKDNINTEDKMHTSAGSLALANSYAQEDAFVVRQLREAGAILLGKTNMTEWANFMTEGMPAGYSSRGGQVLNPYGIQSLSPGGSSSGSGAAVACNFSTVSIGTETSGSILSPASENSIVGIKPTIGLVSRSGIIPISHSQDTAGPMGKTVEDAAILLGVLTGVDVKDPSTSIRPDKALKDYTSFLEQDGLKGARIGVAREVFYPDLSAEEIKIIEDMIGLLKQEGAIIIEDVKIPSTKDLQSYAVMLHEFKNGINAYLATLSDKVQVKTLTDLINYNTTHAEKMLKYGQTVFIKAEEKKGSLVESEYINQRLLDLKLSQEEGIDKAMAQYQLDALIFPGHTGADITARAGYPSITVPAGYLPNGQPIGLTFTAEAFSEGKLIKYAYAFEQKTKKRIPPIL